jgi:hypothetical protein
MIIKPDVGRVKPRTSFFWTRSRYPKSNRPPDEPPNSGDLSDERLFLGTEVGRQYALANATRFFDGLPVTMHFPASSGESKGMHRIVAFVSSEILSSVSRVPSQWA